jgi:hmuY'
MKKSMLLVALATLALGVTSCGKETPDPVKNVVVNATAYDQYVYFSFEQGKVVKTAKYDDEAIKKDKSWDIAFHRYELRTNSGLSGEGNGGAYEVGVQDIRQAVTIPAADKFTPDNQTQAQIIEFKHGDPKAAAPVQKVLPLNPILSTIKEIVVDPDKKGPDGKPATKTKILHEGAIVQNLDNHGTAKAVSWLSNKVFIVRTATGKHAKIKVISHQEPVQTAKGNTPTPGMLRFEYVYPID